MPDHFENFIRAENIRILKARIREETNPDRVRMLESLLKTEEDKVDVGLLGGVTSGRPPSEPRR